MSVKPFSTFVLLTANPLWQLYKERYPIYLPLMIFPSYVIVIGVKFLYDSLDLCIFMGAVLGLSHTYFGYVVTDDDRNR